MIVGIKTLAILNALEKGAIPASVSNDLLARINELLDIADVYMGRKYDHWRDDFDAYRLKQKFRKKLEAYRSSVSG